jgi:23S rRNA (adenine2030-N6)-methyltransferase
VLSYRHQFHAGNFADVFKHALLVQIVRLLARKDKPFVYLETHAGSGRYDLNHPWAQKNREYEQGIARIWERSDAPESAQDYLEAVRAENPDGRLRYYPGSPRLVRRQLRDGDRMVLAELNARDCAELRTLFARDPQVQVREVDGYQALKASLPPRERRGLVLIDSSFDRAREFARLLAALADACQRFATGVYALWYPLLEPAVIRRFERDVAALGIERMLRFELAVHDESWQEGMRGSAMLIVNPPWQLEELASPLLEWLWRALAAGGAGGWKVGPPGGAAQPRTTKLTMRPGT